MFWWWMGQRLCVTTPNWCSHSLPCSTLLTVTEFEDLELRSLRDSWQMSWFFKHISKTSSRRDFACRDLDVPCDLCWSRIPHNALLFWQRWDLLPICFPYQKTAPFSNVTMGTFNLNFSKSIWLQRSASSKARGKRTPQTQHTSICRLYCVTRETWRNFVCIK